MYIMFLIFQSDILLYAVVPVVNRTVCQEAWGRPDQVSTLRFNKKQKTIKLKVSFK
jgi:hypothetical protein